MGFVFCKWKTPGTVDQTIPGVFPRKER